MSKVINAESQSKMSSTIIKSTTTSKINKIGVSPSLHNIKLCDVN